jgi:hypothetical protein
LPSSPHIARAPTESMRVNHAPRDYGSEITIFAAFP